MCSCTSSGDLLGAAPDEKISSHERGIVSTLLPDAGHQRVGGGVGQLVEPALKGGGRRLGVVPGSGDALVPQMSLQVGDVHAQSERLR